MGEPIESAWGTGGIVPPNRADVLVIVFSYTERINQLLNEQTWVPMALTWEQRLAEQMLFISHDTRQVEAQAFLNQEEPWRRSQGGLLHEPVFASVDWPIIPVSIAEGAWNLAFWADLGPVIRPEVEGLTASMEEFQDKIDPETLELNWSYAVDLIVGGSKANRADPDHCRELDFHGLVTEFAENNVRLVTEPYRQLPHPWNKWVPAESHQSLLALLNS